MIAYEFDRDDAAIDALVDGELSGEDRRAVLERLEATPGGWRQCALAFLEAQTWRQALGEAAREAPPSPEIRVRPRAVRVAPWIARAATVLVAFGLGWAVRTPRVEVVSPVAKAPVPVPGRSTPKVDPSMILAQKPTAPPGYLRGRLEREGYRVEQMRVLVPTATKDGRPVAVPVQRTRVRFVGNRSV